MLTVVAQQHSGFWQQNSPALIALLGVLIASCLGFWQWRRSQHAQKELERTRLDWEREKLNLEDQIARERSEWEDRRQAAAKRAEAEEAIQAQLLTQLEQADSQERQAIAYRQALVGELGNLKILDMTKPLDLEALYVQVQIREEEPSRYITDDEIAKLTHGDPEQLLRLSQAHLTERGVLALAPEEALRRFNRIAVLGDPGAGKTTMLRYLAFRSARGELAGSLVLPVYVELRRFVDSGLVDLLDFTTKEWGERYGFIEARPYLEQELAAGHSALLLDGLDEVLGGDTAEAANAAYNRVAQEIGRLATRFPNAPIAVTCRRAGWRGKLGAFQTFEVLDFSWEQIQVFIKNWFAETPTRVVGLLQALTGNLRMQTMAANPLILSLIAIVYEQELELPERRAQLYNRCIDVLLKEWDAHRDIHRFARFTTDRKRDLLEEVAWHFHRRGWRYFPKSELLEVISAFLPTVALPSEDANAILDEIAAHYGLLKQQAQEWYGFLHLTMQEYFAAVAANERSPLALDEVVGNRHNPWWQEVVLLLAGRTTDATPLLLRILGRDPHGLAPEEGERLAKDDDLFHGDLFLAARCLVGTPRIRNSWLRGSIVAEVRQLLLKPTRSGDQEAASRVLAEIGGELLTSQLLQMLQENEMPAILTAFEQLGDATVAPRLLALLQEPDVINERLQVSISVTLGVLRCAPAIPRVLQIFESFVEKVPSEEARPQGSINYDTTISYDIGRVARALGSLGDPVAVAPIMAAVRKLITWPPVESGSAVGACMSALQMLGDNTVVPELFEFMEGPRGHKTEGVAEAIASLGGPSAAPRLLKALLDKNIDGPKKPSIAKALRELSEPATVPSIIEALNDEKQPWELRWLLTEALEGCQEMAAPALAEILAKPNLDERVRIGIATTLGTWKDRLGLPYMRAAIKDDLLPYDLVFYPPSGGTYIYTAYLLRRIVGVLWSFDEGWITPFLAERLDSILQELNQKSPRNNELPRPVSSIAHALGDKAPESIADSLMQISRQYSSWSSTFNSPLSVLTIVLSKPVMPKIIRFIEDNSPLPEWWDSWDTERLLRTVGSVADDPQTATCLLGILRQITDRESASSYGRTLEDALRDLCQRARIRIFADGRVLSIVSSL